MRNVVKSMIGAVEFSGTFPPGGIYSGPMLDPGNYRGGGTGGQWLFGNDGFNYKFSYSGNSDAGSAYENCAPLAAVINKKAKSYINGKTWIMNNRGKEASGEQANKLRKLLAKPNTLQSWKQFEAQQNIYINLFGYCILMPIIPAGFEQFGPIEASSIWNIPPFMVDVTETNKLFYQTDLRGILQSVVLNYKGVKTVLDVQNLYIFKDITPSFTSAIFPDSRVRAIQAQIGNIMGAYESRNVLINRRGAMGILSNAGKDPLGTIAIDADEKKMLQMGFSSYGLRKDQWQVIVTNAALQWQQMGYPTKDLMLFEEVEDDIMRICDAYDFPYRLLASTRNNSLGGSDAEVFLRNLYQDAVIPEAESTYEQWNQFFKTADMNLSMQKDYEHLPVLQADKVSEGRARFYMNQALQIEFENNLVTVNQWLDANDMDPLPDPKGSMFYSDMIQAGMSFGQNKTTLTGVEPVEAVNVTDATMATDNQNTQS